MEPVCPENSWVDVWCCVRSCSFLFVCFVFFCCVRKNFFWCFLRLDLRYSFRSGEVIRRNYTFHNVFEMLHNDHRYISLLQWYLLSSPPPFLRDKGRLSSPCELHGNSTGLMGPKHSFYHVTLRCALSTEIALDGWVTVLCCTFVLPSAIALDRVTCCPVLLVNRNRICRAWIWMRRLRFSHCLMLSFNNIVHFIIQLLESHLLKNDNH